MQNHEIHDQSPDLDAIPELPETNGKSRKVRAGFATLAVAGLGAGLTLAAWTGNVDFMGTARAGATDVDSVVLHGAVTTGTDDAPSFADGPVTVDGLDFDTESVTSQTRYLWVTEADSEVLTSVAPSASSVELGDWGTVVVGDFSEVAGSSGTIWRAQLTASLTDGELPDNFESDTFTIPVTGTVG